MSSIDAYRKSFEESLKEAKQYGCKIPSKVFNNLNQQLLEILFLDGSDPEVESIYQSAIDVNEKDASPKLTFSKSSCSYKQGRFSCFYPNELKAIEVDNPDNKIDGFYNAVGNFGERFCTIHEKGAFIHSLADSARDLNITYREAFELGVQFRKNKIMGYVEDDDNTFCYCYANWMNCEMFVHNPDNVVGIGEPIFEIEFIKETQTSTGEFDLKVPILKLSSQNIWTAQARAEFEYEICKGFSVRRWIKAFSFGINAIWDVEKVLEFDSPNFKVKITGTKSLFDVVQPLNIELSEAAAKKFLD